MKRYQLYFISNFHIFNTHSNQQIQISKCQLILRLSDIQNAAAEGDIFQMNTQSERHVSCIYRIPY